ncbi:hypothetical protein LX32DRAFT_687835 [Colletotrichum zoysiae]|uniref:Uncharacterized protein n=1 Tax=Colletotrichum zoysiae TaxID=1216348 RepID=A0AAD9LU57_9PEZI|nr:hypothetical protein LX32DRAFT_687835 [Colletotrichum zoysiae]
MDEKRRSWVCLVGKEAERGLGLRDGVRGKGKLDGGTWEGGGAWDLERGTWVVPARRRSRRREARKERLQYLLAVWVSAYLCLGNNMYYLFVTQAELLAPCFSQPERARQQASTMPLLKNLACFQKTHGGSKYLIEVGMVAQSDQTAASKSLAVVYEDDASVAYGTAVTAPTVLDKRHLYFVLWSGLDIPLVRLGVQQVSSLYFRPLRPGYPANEWAEVGGDKLQLPPLRESMNGKHTCGGGGAPAAAAAAADDAMQPENDRVHQDAGRRLAGDSDARLPLLITTLSHPFAVLVQK